MAEKVSQAKIDAYIRSFQRLVDTQPGTEDFNIEQASTDALWASLNTAEKAAAYEAATPLRGRLTK